MPLRWCASPRPLVAKSRETAAQPAAAIFAHAPTSVGHRALRIEQSHCMLTFIAAHWETFAKLAQMANGFEKSESWRAGPHHPRRGADRAQHQRHGGPSHGSSVIGDTDAWFFDRSFSELGKDGAA